MEKNTLKQFQKTVTWQSRVYAFVVIATVVFAEVFSAWDNNWVTTIIAVVALVLFLDTFNLTFHRHPRRWQLFKWLLILLALALLLTGVL